MHKTQRNRLLRRSKNTEHTFFCFLYSIQVLTIAILCPIFARIRHYNLIITAIIIIRNIHLHFKVLNDFYFWNFNILNDLNVIIVVFPYSLNILIVFAYFLKDLNILIVFLHFLNNLNILIVFPHYLNDLNVTNH